MPKYLATKQFDYSPDGHSTTTVKPGDEVDVREDMVSGLLTEGFIADGSAAETASKVAGAAIKHADLSDVVSDTEAVRTKIDQAEAGISDGHIGGPEAAALVHEHAVITTLPAVGENVPEADQADPEHAEEPGDEHDDKDA